MLTLTRGAKFLSFSTSGTGGNFPGSVSGRYQRFPARSLSARIQTIGFWRRIHGPIALRKTESPLTPRTPHTAIGNGNFSENPPIAPHRAIASHCPSVTTSNFIDARSPSKNGAGATIVSPFPIPRFRATASIFLAKSLRPPRLFGTKTHPRRSGFPFHGGK